jgi:hypothetical protein
VTEANTPRKDNLLGTAHGLDRSWGCRMSSVWLALKAYLLYNNSIMGPPRGSKHTAMVNGRITAEQMEWLQARADELGGNLSAALRQTITDARLLEMVRADYRVFRDEHPEILIPPGAEGASYLWDTMLVLKMTETEDLELRQEESDAG